MRDALAADLITPDVATAKLAAIEQALATLGTTSPDASGQAAEHLARLARARVLCTPAGFRRWLAQASPATKRQVLVDWIEKGVIERHPEGHKLTLTVRTPKGLVVTHDAKGSGVLCP